MRKTGIALAAIVMSGCASYQPVPKDYAGPVATISDSGFSESRAKAQLFAVTSVDGNSIFNAFNASAAASHNKGFWLTPEFPSRLVPVRPMQIGLSGSHAMGAPIHEMASQIAGTFFSVGGTVSFTPKADTAYVVKGELKKNASCVWIEEQATRRRVIEPVCEK